MDDATRKLRILNDTPLWLRIGEIAHLQRQVYGTDVHGIERRINEFLETQHRTEEGNGSK